MKTQTDCNCIMSGYAQTTNYCPVHKGQPMTTPQHKIDEHLSHNSFSCEHPDCIAYVKKYEETHPTPQKEVIKEMRLTIDEEGKRYFNGMPDYEYLKIEALNRIAEAIENKKNDLPAFLKLSDGTILTPSSSAYWALIKSQPKEL